MPAWGDMLTVNDIWDVTNFIRTIPNGGLRRDNLTASMMVSPGDIKPIEVTPIAAPWHGRKQRARSVRRHAVTCKDT